MHKRIVVILLIAVASCRPVESAPPEAHPASGAAPPTPVSAAVLALLPDGVEKREFLLDCTGCHQMDEERVFPGGRARTREEWRAIVARMIAFAGWQSGFPIMSAARDADRTADFLAAHLTTPPAATPVYPGVVRADVREYAYPYAQDLPHDLAIDATGHVVITGMFSHRMLVLDPATGEYDEVQIPIAQANPRALDIDARGDWWVLLGAPGRVARYRPSTGEWQSWEVGMYGHDVRPDGRGGAWFNGHFSKQPEQIGRVDATAGTVRIIDVPGPTPDASGGGPIPYGMRIASDGVVWMSELHGNRMVAYDPAAGRFDFHDMPTASSGPRRFDIDAQGVLWIPEYAAGRLARLDPRSGEFREYALPFTDALPYVVAVDEARNRIWIGTGAADAVFVFDPLSGRFAAVPLPTRGALVRHIDVDGRTGDLWAAYGASPGIPPKIARIRVE